VLALGNLDQCNPFLSSTTYFPMPTPQVRPEDTLGHPLGCAGGYDDPSTAVRPIASRIRCFLDVISRGAGTPSGTTVEGVFS